MNPTCRPARGRPGTTLIEVVLGLVVLSTLLVSVAIARGRFARQWADAERRLRLVRVADDLIAQWLATAPRPVPIGQGTLGPDTGATWRTRILPDRGAVSLNAVVVRLDLFDARDGSAPAVSIDFLERDPSLATTQPAGPS